MTTRENIFLGTSANDATGDTLRAAGAKINRNFVRIFQMLGSDSDYLSLRLTLDSDGVIYNGISYTSELTFTEPTSNRTLTLPNTSGTISVINNAETLENKTLLNPVINDINSNELIKFTTVSSAVNEITLSNNSTGNAPSLSATGDNTNINLNLNSKNLGSVNVSKLATNNEVINVNSSVDLSTGWTIFNSATDLSITMNNGTTVGEQKFFTNRGTGLATVTPTSFAGGSSFTVFPQQSLTLVWDSDAWYVLNNTTLSSLNYHSFVSKTLNTTATTTVALDTFDKTIFAGADVIVTAIQGSNRHIIKMSLVHDGTNTFETLHDSANTGSNLFTLGSAVVGSTIEIQCTPGSTTSTDFKTYVNRIEN